MPTPRRTSPPPPEPDPVPILTLGPDALLIGDGRTVLEDFGVGMYTSGALFGAALARIGAPLLLIIFLAILAGLAAVQLSRRLER